MDDGAVYFFDFFAKTHADLLPLFLVGYWASSWLVATVVVACAAWILAANKRHQQALIVLLAYLLGHGLVALIHLAAPRSMPTFAFKWLNLSGVALADQASSTFPSTSIFLSAMAWLFLLLTLRQSPRHLAYWSVLALSPVVVFGGFVCNLCLGRHYLTDLLAGLAGGAGMALVAWSFSPKPQLETGAFPSKA